MENGCLRPDGALRQDESPHSGAHRSTAARRSSRRSGTARPRRLFFIIAGVWGFLLGWLSRPLGLSFTGERPPLFTPAILATTGALLLLTLVGVLLLHNSYTEFRREHQPRRES